MLNISDNLKNLNLVPADAKGKHPTINWKSYQNVKYDGEITTDGVGALTGLNNHYVLDIDDGSFYEDNLMDKINTFTVKTGKGYHLHFFCLDNEEVPKNVVGWKDEKGRTLDVRGKGGFIMLPPSKHYTKDGVHDCNYEISKDVPILTYSFETLKEKLREIGVSVNMKKTNPKEIAKKGSIEGNRNDDMFKALAHARDHLDYDDVEIASLAETINSKNKPPLKDSELSTIVNSVCNRVEKSDGKLKHRRKKSSDDEDEERENDILRDKALEEIERTIITPNGSEVYVSVYINGVLENFSLSSVRARRWLIGMDEHVHTESFYKSILQNIEANARNEKCNKQEVYTRIAQTKNTIWYDLGTEDWSAVKVTPGKVEIVQLDLNSPMFRRPDSLHTQTQPIYDPQMKALDKFVDLLKIQDKLIFKVNLISCFFEDMSTPMMLLMGEAGSFKTTITAFIKRLIDPIGIKKDDNIFALQQNHDDLIIFLSKRYMPAFDNIGTINDDTSDIFCRAVTGGANQKRQLYSDDDEILFSFKRKIVMNGIDINPEQTDFISRMITYPRNPEVKRRTDVELEREFESLKPYVLGEIFQIISEVLGKEPIIEPKFRLTDFEKYGDLIARCLGEFEFQKIYTMKRTEVDNLGMENHPLVATMDKMLEDNDNQPVKLQTSEMYNKLVSIHKQLTADGKIDDKFPKAPRVLNGEIEKCKPLLRSIKIVTLKTTESGNKSFIQVSRLKDNALDS